MGPCNGFPSRLWQLVRTFTVKLVMAKSELLFTKFVGKDTTRSYVKCPFEKEMSLVNETSAEEVRVSYVNQTINWRTG